MKLDDISFHNKAMG